MNPKAAALIVFFVGATFSLLLAGVALWWVALVLWGLYTLYAISF